MFKLLFFHRLFKRVELIENDTGKTYCGQIIYYLEIGFDTTIECNGNGTIFL